VPAERKPTAYERRLREAHRLHREHVPEREIASRMGVSLPTVRKYLAAPSESRVTKPSQTQPTAFPGSGEGSTLSSRERALRERIRVLRDERFVRAAIADRLGKSDRTIGRYLLILEREEAAA
jgi:IS30 family transposase